MGTDFIGNTGIRSLAQPAGRCTFDFEAAMATATATRRSSSRRQAAAEEADAGPKRADQEAVSSGDSEEEEVELCVVCRTKRPLVTLVCSECAHCYHLGCHSPKLTRRPKLVDAWKCHACASKTTAPEDGKESIVAVTRSSRAQKIAMEAHGTSETTEASATPKNNEAKTIAVAVKPEVQAEEKKPSKRAAVSTTASRTKAKKTAAAGDASEGKYELDKDQDSDTQTIIKRPRVAASKTKLKASKAKTPALKAKLETKAVAAVSESKVDLEEIQQPSKRQRLYAGESKALEAKVVSKAKAPASSKLKEEIKVQDDSSDSDEPLAKTTIRTKSGAKAPVQRKPTRRGKAKVESSPRPVAKSKRMMKKKAYLDDDDDDGDSDFVDDDEEDEVSSVSLDDESGDDDFVAKKKLPSLKTATAKRRASPSKPKGTGPKRVAKTTGDPDESVGQEPDDNGNGGGDMDESEDEYLGPGYSVEYAANNRAKCKSCEEKLMKDQLRVAVIVKHSMFGITTYFKHLACTQICSSVSESTLMAQRQVDAAKQINSSEPDEEANVNPSPKKSTVQKDEPIRGFYKLKSSDQVLVREHMEKNQKIGQFDERLELADEHYKKKACMPEKEPSPHLTVPLLPYQREALAWMTAQEKSAYKGGILADEMGMGKTIQAISVILENKRVVDVKPKPKASASSIIRGGTLVVCPLVAVMQWKSEIERFVDKGHFSIYIHHGNKREDLASRIASYDIVLTTYSIIESEIRKTLGWAKVPCKYCKKKYLPDKLILHNKYFCGPNAKKTRLQDKQQTKRGATKKAAGESDVEEEDDYPKKPARKVPAARGKKKQKDPSDDESDEDDDVGIQKKATKGKSPLHQITWTRIVLDEAHYIKDRRCNTARGVFELKSEFKWCLTGTPLQNRIGELFSLIRFLQIESYAYYHCNKCECQLLDYDFPDGKCTLCQHPAMHHYSYFNKKIVIPIQSYGYVAEGKIAMLRLQNDVLQHILLRRTKEGRADDICLPPKLVRIRKDRLDERENDFYEAIYTQSQAQFNTYVSSGTLLNNYAHIFDLLIRLRQAVDHPYLVIFSKSNPALQLPLSAAASPGRIRPVVEEKPLISTQVDEEDGDGNSDQICAICHEDIEDSVLSKCGHSFCRECVTEFIASLPVGGKADCPTCSKPLTVDLAPKTVSIDEELQQSKMKNPRPSQVTRLLSTFHKNSILHRISDVQSFQTSTKIEALMQELELMRIRDPSGKAIIFSQFVNMLDIIQHRLQLGGVKCVKLSGNMSMDVRDRTIRAFREDSSITAFLISLKAGGVALNLTVASHIFLMDPWWNPAAENQAIDRTHRLGQFKPITATRFIIAGTIEERILKLQEKKRLIFEGTVGASASAICRLTEEDLRFLFSR